MDIPFEMDFISWANAFGFQSRFMKVEENIRTILEQTNLLTILAGAGIGLLLIMGTVIIINQSRIRKQLRQIQQQLEQKDKPE